MRLRASWAAQTEAKAERKKRGMDGQVQVREMERRVRMGVVAFGRWAEGQQRPAGEAAATVGMSVATFANWRARWENDRMALKPRGRKAVRADAETRQGVRTLFQLTGPGVPLATLEAAFPKAARRELEDLARKYREEYREENQLLVHVLRWWRSGSVWAMDFTDAPTPIDGEFPHILVVRDLASGAHILALPAREQTAAVVRAALQALFLEHGAPLVIKSDNGGHFRAQQVRDFLAAWNVEQLLSPPYLPQYNGACEAGIGSLKTRIHYESVRHGRPGEWTSDDVETARLKNNEVMRPWGRAFGSPAESWRQRSSPETIRDPFRRTLHGALVEVRAQMGYPWEGPLGESEYDAIQRAAITRALVKRELLSFRRSRISPPIKAGKAVKIT